MSIQKTKKSLVILASVAVLVSFPVITFGMQDNEDSIFGEVAAYYKRSKTVEEQEPTNNRPLVKTIMDNKNKKLEPYRPVCLNPIGSNNLKIDMSKDITPDSDDFWALKEDFFKPRNKLIYLNSDELFKYMKKYVAFCIKEIKFSTDTVSIIFNGEKNQENKKWCYFFVKQINQSLVYLLVICKCLYDRENPFLEDAIKQYRLLENAKLEFAKRCAPLNVSEVNEPAWMK
jgi:hypothetical protein